MSCESHWNNGKSWGPCVLDEQLPERTTGFVAKLIHLTPFCSADRPCHHIPGVKANQKTIDLTDQNHPRIERAFRQLFHRSDLPIPAEASSSHDVDSPSHEDTDHRGDRPEQHEFEVVICHANVIRYFMCR